MSNSKTNDLDNRYAAELTENSHDEINNFLPASVPRSARYNKSVVSQLERKQTQQLFEQATGREEMP